MGFQYEYYSTHHFGVIMPVPGNLPAGGQKIFEKVMESLKGKKNPRTGESYTDEERGKIAWSAVKNKYKRTEEGWELKSEPSEDWDYCFNSEPLEFKSEEGNYYFTGYLSTFDMDLVNDIVTPGCMSDMLEQIKAGMDGRMRSFKGSPDHDVYWEDDSQLKPISRIVDARLDNKGLWVKGLFNSAHPEFDWKEIQNKFYDGLSIEYKAKDFSFKDLQNGNKARILNKVQLKGYGHTPRPANPFATLTDCFIKSIDIADAENEIKEIGSNDYTQETISYHMNDELNASEDYKKLGLIDFANDEKRHYEFWKQKKAEMAIKVSDEEKAIQNAKSEVKTMTDEVKAVTEAAPQPAPPSEVKTEEKAEKKEAEETEEEKKKKENEKGKDCEAKAEVKSVLTDEMKSFLVQTIKDELKSMVSEKKSLPNTLDEKGNPIEKFEVKENTPSTLIGHIVKGLGGN